MDHYNFWLISDLKELATRAQCWRLRLIRFEFEVQYLSARKHVTATVFITLKFARHMIQPWKIYIRRQNHQHECCHTQQQLNWWQVNTSKNIGLYRTWHLLQTAFKNCKCSRHLKLLKQIWYASERTRHNGATLNFVCFPGGHSLVEKNTFKWYLVISNQNEYMPR